VAFIMEYCMGMSFSSFKYAAVVVDELAVAVRLAFGLVLVHFALEGSLEEVARLFSGGVRAGGGRGAQEGDGGGGAKDGLHGDVISCQSQCRRRDAFERDRPEIESFVNGTFVPLDSDPRR
jgi:hypothetical protein